jgi:uncharacterized coiled-coil DUF342 family protein
MMSEERKHAMTTLLSRLKQERDELRVQMHLAKSEAKDELKSLEGKLTDLNDRFEPTKQALGETADQVWESLKLVGDELLNGFHRIRKSL